MINRILIMTSIPPTVIPTVTGSRNQTVANTTLITGSSIDTKEAVDAPSRLTPYSIRKNPPAENKPDPTISITHSGAPCGIYLYDL